MNIEKPATERIVNLHGLYEYETEDEEIEERFFAISMVYDEDTSVEDAVYKCLTSHSIMPSDIIEFQTAYVEEKSKLDIEIQ